MKIHVNKRRWYLALINALLVLLAGAAAVFFWIISGTLETVHTAERWKGESELRFAQVSCFLPVDASKSVNDVMSFRQQLDQLLLEASLRSQQGGDLYADAFSGSAAMKVEGEHGSADVCAVGVGGNFFLFHPLRLLSGSYIQETDLMQDRVVLDEVAAWQLFGGSDVAGATVWISGNPYFVAGVVRLEDDFASKKANLNEATIFISYDAFDELTGLSDGITCYEVVMPNVVSEYALNIVKDKFPVGKGDIVEISSRYSFKSLLKTAGDFGMRSMRNNGVIYPYWENALRLTEDYLALLLILMIILLVCPALTILICLLRRVIKGCKRLKRWIPKKVDELVERRREKSYAGSER